MTPTRLLALALLAAAAIPARALVVSHTGYLLGASDQPQTGTVGLRFRLYDTASGGTLLWTGEVDASTACPVAVNAGYYVAELGDSCGPAIPAGPFAGGATVWLEVEAGGITLSPRQPLREAPAARGFSGSLAGDVTGTQGSTVVASVGGVSAASVALGTAAANGAASANTAGAIVKRDAGGAFTAGAITASSIAGDGSALTSLDASQVSAGTLDRARGGLGTSAASVAAGAVYAGPTGSTGAAAFRSLAATDLPSGLLATQSPSSVNITGGSISGVAFSSQGISDGASSTALTISPAGSVGIGSGTPGSRLDVNGTVTATGLKLPTGAAAGHVLTSDASGNATWAAAPGGSSQWTTGANGLHTNGSVGVGAGASSAARLYVQSGASQQSLVLTDASIYGANFEAATAGMRLRMNGTQTFGITQGSSAPGTSRFHIDGAGNVGLGTTAPLGNLEVHGNSANAVRMFIQNDDGPATGGGNEFLSIGMYGSSAFGQTPWQNAALIESQGPGGLVLGAYGSPMKFQTGIRSTAMQITAAGNVFVNMNGLAFNAGEKLSVGGGVGAYSPDTQSALSIGNQVTGATNVATFYGWTGSGWAGRGTITTSGSGTAYNTTSDRRLKDHIVPTTLGLGTLLKIPVRDYEFRTDPSGARQQGFIAQELAEVYPQAVRTNGDDGVAPLEPKATPWQVDYGRLTPLLVASTQELSASLDDTRRELTRKLDAQARTLGELEARAVAAERRAAELAVRLARLEKQKR